MCQKIGFSGFQEFKMKMLEEVINMEKEEINFDTGDIDKRDDTKTVIEKLTKLSISALKETKLLQETEMINIVADLITKSDVLDFYGIGASHIVCL